MKSKKTERKRMQIFQLFVTSAFDSWGLSCPRRVAVRSEYDATERRACSAGDQRIQRCASSGVSYAGEQCPWKHGARCRVELVFSDV